MFLQEIQDRIRIIELYAKDRQFADFVRQHQAWVPFLFFLLYCSEINTWAKKARIWGKGKLRMRYWSLARLHSKKWLVRWAMPNQCGNRFIILKSSPARPRADTVWQKLLWDTDIPSSSNGLAVAVRLCLTEMIVFKPTALFHGDPWCQIMLSKAAGSCLCRKWNDLFSWKDGT